MRKRILVLGSNFAGFTAALTLKRLLGAAHDVVVVSQNDEFTFTPALVRVLFGLRDRTHLGFAVRPAFDRAGVVFKQMPVTRIELGEKYILTAVGREDYDYLLIATGAVSDFDTVKGLHPKDGHNHSIMTWDEAHRARAAFDELILKPGPVVVGVVQGGWHFSVAYELALGLAGALQRRGLGRRVPLTFVTPEPYLGHFGVDGVNTSRQTIEKLFHEAGIEAIVNCSVKEVAPEQVLLDDGRSLPSAFSLLIPAMRGVDVVRRCRDIVDAHGFVNVDHGYQTLLYQEVFATGSAVATGASSGVPVPRGVPKSGYFAEESARVAAYNIAASINGARHVHLSPIEIDAKGIVDAAIGPDLHVEPKSEPTRALAAVVPGLNGHWANTAYMRYFSKRTKDP
ncbi:MAG: FAD-dependent oxidoreductase [Sandaracinaceae bacterium]|nr:FAD-dependent oxidoreductase [Sandaracinaceae bacterium]